ncbi:hypothetical protein ACHHRT_12980 [Desulfurivibrio sp. D14AmB]|uniref:hypothetical protein n=1 Tax=Desulfurivibrio sp. D14AmB TaxID=3374370 RepID=UPI00376ED766
MGQQKLVLLTAGTGPDQKVFTAVILLQPGHVGQKTRHVGIPVKNRGKQADQPIGRLHLPLKLFMLLPRIGIGNGQRYQHGSQLFFQIRAGKQKPVKAGFKQEGPNLRLNKQAGKTAHQLGRKHGGTAKISKRFGSIRYRQVVITQTQP